MKFRKLLHLAVETSSTFVWKEHSLCINFAPFRWYWDVFVYWACFPNNGVWPVSFWSRKRMFCYVILSLRWLCCDHKDFYGKHRLATAEKNVFSDEETGVLRDQCMLSSMVLLWSFKDIYHNIYEFQFSKNKIPFTLTEINLTFK